MCGAGGANRIYVKGDFDYVESDIESKMKAQLPLSFGGASGGGLWFVPLSLDRDNEPQPIDHILAGVIFYQSALVNNSRFLKSHGIKSVYEVAYNKIIVECT